jgi:hypothetical protein
MGRGPTTATLGSVGGRPDGGRLAIAHAIATGTLQQPIDHVIALLYSALGRQQLAICRSGIADSPHRSVRHRVVADRKMPSLPGYGECRAPPSPAGFAVTSFTIPMRDFTGPGEQA